LIEVEINNAPFSLPSKKGYCLGRCKVNNAAFQPSEMEYRLDLDKITESSFPPPLKKGGRGDFGI
jgi:hypothetical protein